ncbi:MAG: AGE family epimerase/isomerase [Alkalispirochaeta sp.]
MNHMEELAGQYWNALHEDVLPFWLHHSLDREHGGYLTCLNAVGDVYDTDKFLWLQGRETWLFSALYNRLEPRGEWLDAAALGARFLKSHGRNQQGDWYFAVDRHGRPVSGPWSIFSDCFVSMGLSQYALAAGDEEAARIARETYERIWVRKRRHLLDPDPDVRAHRPIVEFPLSMILINLCLEFAWMLPEERVQNDCRHAVDEVMHRFLDRATMLVRECVSPDGSSLDSFEGRRINPGHGVEAMWIVIAGCELLGDKETAQIAAEVALRQLEFGWDQEHGGIFAFLDIEGRPPQELEWDQKLWWAHLESIVTMLVSYNRTGVQEYLNWFDRLHEYTWLHFPDHRCGEWWGYLNRRGEVSLPIKGGKWKGCFHVPRGLWMAALELGKAAATPEETP